MDQLERKTSRSYPETRHADLSVRCPSTVLQNTVRIIYRYFFLSREEVVTIIGKYRILLYYRVEEPRVSMTGLHVPAGSGRGTRPIVNIFFSSQLRPGTGERQQPARVIW